MKKIISVSALCLALGSLLFSCTLETSDNGKLDGFWKLTRVDTLATGGVLDLRESGIFWAVQMNLMSVQDKYVEDSPEYLFRFEHKDGKLTLSAGYLYSIRDRKKAKVEDRLGDALELLFLTAFQLSQDHESRGDREAFESFNRELERTEELIQLAKDYEDAERIRKLLKAVQKKLGTGELEYKDYFPTWAAWASEKAEWLDPTVGFHDAILGRRHDPILQPPKNNS